MVEINGVVYRLRLVVNRLRLVVYRLRLVVNRLRLVVYRLWLMVYRLWLVVNRLWLIVRLGLRLGMIRLGRVIVNHRLWPRADWLRAFAAGIVRDQSPFTAILPFVVLIFDVPAALFKNRGS